MQKGKLVVKYIVRETTYPLATKQEVIGELVRCSKAERREQ